MKVISIGRSKEAVRMTHAKRSLSYFIDNFYKEQGYYLTPWQEELIKKLEKKNETPRPKV